MKNTRMYAGYRYPAQIISHAVWLYYLFTLCFRDIEELLAARGIIVSYETIRTWCLLGVHKKIEDGYLGKAPSYRLNWCYKSKDRNGLFAITKL